MYACGLYDFSGEWAYHVGLPAKSGVAGGMLAVVPGCMAIAVFSPRLDARGNSVRGNSLTDLWGSPSMLRQAQHERTSSELP